MTRAMFRSKSVPFCALFNNAFISAEPIRSPATFWEMIVILTHRLLPIDSQSVPCSEHLLVVGDFVQLLGVDDLEVSHLGARGFSIRVEDSLDFVVEGVPRRFKSPPKHAVWDPRIDVNGILMLPIGVEEICRFVGPSPSGDCNGRHRSLWIIPSSCE